MIIHCDTFKYFFLVGKIENKKLRINAIMHFMGKGLVIAMIIAVAVFGGLILFNHSNTNAVQGVNVDLTPSPTPMHLVIATPSGALVASPAPATVDKPIVATQAAIETSKGTILLTLFPDAAPKAVTNFVNKIQSGFYNGLTFHRVENWVIQGGDPKGNGTGGGDMATELNNKPFVIGSLGMAGHPGPDGKTINNDAQFFITKSDSSWLNGQYTNFGIVTSGIDVVNKIAIGDKILRVTLQ